MKKILKIILIPTLFTLVFLRTEAQTITASGAILKTGSNLDLANLTLVTGISTFNNSSITSLVITDSLRGGIFDVYTGTDVSDNGIVFTDAISRKWKRRLYTNKINIQWYGAIATTTGSNNDAYAQINAAKDYVYAHKGFTLYIPATAVASGQYYVSAKLSFLQSIKIIGDATEAGYPLSTLVFPLNTSAMEILTSSTSPNYSSIKNLYILTSPSSTPDTLKHGVIINCVVEFENMLVRYFSGDGIHLAACGYPGHPIFGNSDRSKFTNVEADYNNLNGFFFDGCDANLILITNCSAAVNNRWGYFDNGQLGNNYLNCYANGNGSPSTVSYGGKIYVSIAQNYAYGVAVMNNTNKQPDINPTYWAVLVNGAGTPMAWSNAIRYYSGGSYSSSDPNNLNTYFGCYSEEGGPGARLVQRNLTVGGNQGAGVTGGGFLTAEANSLFAKSPLTLVTLPGQNNLRFYDYYSPLGGSYYINRIHTSNQLQLGYDLQYAPNIILDTNFRTSINVGQATPSYIFEDVGTLPATIGNNETHFTPSKLFFGNGTGYTYSLSKKNLGVVTDLFTFNDFGNLKIASLAGTGTRNVTADLNGNLSTALSGIFYSDNRTIVPTSISSQTINWGFTAFNNDGNPPYADYIQPNSWSDGSGGNKNLISFNKSSIGIRVWQAPYTQSTAFTSYKDVAFTSDLATIPGTFLNVQILTSGTVYTPTSGTSSVLIKLIGGGGGGGGVTGVTSAAAAAAGGGSGGYLEKYLSGISGTYSISIGSSGTGGANTGGNGASGGNTTFISGGTTYTAYGRSGGEGMIAGTAIQNAAGGTGGIVSTNGAINAGGSMGGSALRLSGSLETSGAGGSSQFGSGGNSIINASTAGNIGTGYGVGGSGAGSINNTANAGGTGKSGVIIIYEYK